MYIKDGSKKDYAGDMRRYGLPFFKNLYTFNNYTQARNDHIIRSGRSTDSN